MILSGLDFIPCSAVIVFSGTFLSLYGDVLAEKTGLGRAWIEKKKIAEFVDEMAQTVRYEHITTREAVIKYLGNAVVIIGAATGLPFISDRLATATGLRQSFFGAVFVTMKTSLLELVASISALKIGATDMAIANLFGNNMSNIFIAAVDDIVYVKVPLLSAISANHAITGFIAVLMTGIAIISLTHRLEKNHY